MKRDCTLSKDDILFNLKKGLEAEYRALKLCNDLFEILEDEKDKEQINRIIEDEKEHIQISAELTEMVDKYY
jgi:rubrerythrin